MSRAETIEKLRAKRTQIQLWMGQIIDHLGPYPYGPGKEQLLDWQMVVEEINRDLVALGDRP